MKCKSPLQGPRNYVDRTCEVWPNYSARTIPCHRAKPKLPYSNCCMKALSHWPEMKNSGRYAPWNFTKKYCTYTRHTLRVYSPPKVNSTPTTVSNIFANSQTVFRFRFFFKKNKPTQSTTIFLTLWIYRRKDRLKRCILVWRDSKKRCVHCN